MTFVKILAPLTGGSRDIAVLASAFAAAKPFNAHVAALFVRPDSMEAVPFYGESVSTAVMQEIAEASQKASDVAARAARATLEASAREAGAVILETPELRSTPSASFPEVIGNFADQVMLAARLSDLVVFGPLREDDRPGLTEAFEATLLETGRPVLLSPYAAPVTFCRKVALAWNQSVAAAHAVTAAVPLLKCAESVEILAVSRSKGETIDCAELRSYLKLRGIKGGAGLLVAGGYGHSRLREMFFSGVTRTVVSHAALPLFLVH